MRAVLTPEQQARATELRKERKGDTGGRKEQMRQRLGLTDQQVKDIAEIRKNGGSRDDIRAVLTPEQQARFDSGRGKQQGGKHSSAPN
jgi:Spy/CpxP family protein refolding chaperone